MLTTKLIKVTKNTGKNVKTTIVALWKTQYFNNCSWFTITTEIQCCCHLIPLYTCYRLNSQQLCITNTNIVFENTMILQQAKLWTKSQALHLEHFCCVMSIVKVLHSFRIHSKFTRVSEIMQ